MSDRRHLDEIGRLTVIDESGQDHVIIIRREDLTTTNGAYRALRDAISEELAHVLAVNRTHVPA